MKVYMVSTGSYSDFTYIAAFSSKEKAWAYIDESQTHYKQGGIYNSYNAPNNCVEEFEIDGERISELGPLYEIGMHLSDGQVKFIKIIEGRDEKPFYEDDTSIGFNSDQIIFRTHCHAKDVQHAIKIANERRVQYKAEHPEGA